MHDDSELNSVHPRLAAPDYSVHEATYAALRANGHKGWGGDSFDGRERRWLEGVEFLLTDPRCPPPGSDALEVGCGTGVVSRILAQRGYRVSGIDISSTAVEWAKEMAKSEGLKASFVQGNVCEMAMFEDHAFNVVVDGACFHCIIGADRMKFLNEVHRVLKPGGIFLISSMIGEPRDASAPISASVEYDRASRCQVRNGVPYRFMAEKAYVFNELKSAGFEIANERVKENPWWDHLYALAVKPDGHRR